MPIRRWLTTMFVAVAGCSGRIETDNRPAFKIDATQPFRLEFGRGSGWHGLDTVKIDQTGRVVLHRMTTTHHANVTVLSWETAALQLPPDALAEVLDAVDSNGLMGLHKEYHEDIHDGTQWVLWIEQGNNEKSVYFNNRFPSAINEFAKQLDDTLARAGSTGLSWQNVPESESLRHERELWNAIKR